MLAKSMRPEDLGFGKLFERIRDAVIVADAKTQQIVLWNPAASRIFGYSPSEALKLRVEALVPKRLKVEEWEKKRNGGPAGGRACRIVIEDNGIGFDEKHLERIFAPFQRLHGRSSYQGTGMGLAICRKVVERHGGEITAKSVPRQGTSFVVTLPIKRTRRTSERL